MDRRRLLSLLGAASIGSIAGCSSEIPGSGPDRPSGENGNRPEGTLPQMGEPPEVEASTEAFVRGNVSFGLALHRRLAAQDVHANRVLSPYSLGIALAMTYAGARNRTRTEIADALRFQPREEALHREVAALRSDLPLADPSDTSTPTPSTTTTEEQIGQLNTNPFRLLAGNAIWIQSGFSVREAYLDLLGRYYAAGVGRLDFREATTAARETINGWVADRTQGEIGTLFPPGSFSRATRLVLTNAVFFRANWADVFPEEETVPQPFTALDGSTAEVPMMQESLNVPYAEVDGHQVLQLPYAEADIDMALLLPASGAFRSFERDLDATRLAELLSATKPQEGDVALPRFTFRSALSMPRYLKAMGMERAFTPSADFTGMVSGQVGERLKIGDVRHEATIAVDEQGTKAAAATGVEVELVSAPVDPFSVTFDRPFLFAVRHRPTGAILFLGRIVDAAAAQS